MFIHERLLSGILQSLAIIFTWLKAAFPYPNSKPNFYYSYYASGLGKCSQYMHHGQLLLGFQLRLDGLSYIPTG